MGIQPDRSKKIAHANTTALAWCVPRFERDLYYMDAPFVRATQQMFSGCIQAETQGWLEVTRQPRKAGFVGLLGPEAGRPEAFRRQLAHLASWKRKQCPDKPAAQLWTNTTPGELCKLDSSVVSRQQLIIVLYKVPEMVKYEALRLSIFWLLQIRITGLKELVLSYYI